MAVFQVVFGLVVFGVTRQYYSHDSDRFSAAQVSAREPALVWPEGITESSLTQFASTAPGPSDIDDPAEISRRADESFKNNQYGRAAALYERLLEFGPKNAGVYNNLGITLHYLGRSDEALRRLNEGVAIDSNNQRIWLTLGFVNSQLGNIEQARTALTTATQIGSDESVRQSALKMLEGLP